MRAAPKRMIDFSICSSTVCNSFRHLLSQWFCQSVFWFIRYVIWPSHEVFCAWHFSMMLQTKYLNRFSQLWMVNLLLILMLWWLNLWLLMASLRFVFSPIARILLVQISLHFYFNLRASPNLYPCFHVYQYWVWSWIYFWIISLDLDWLPVTVAQSSTFS
jgi:hypothetical protein